MEKYNYYLDINFKDRTSEVEALYEPTLKDIKEDPEMYAELVNDLLFHWIYGTRETPLMVLVKKQMKGEMADGGVMAKGGGVKMPTPVQLVLKGKKTDIKGFNFKVYEFDGVKYALMTPMNGKQYVEKYLGNADGGMMAKGGVPRKRYDNGGMMAKGGETDEGKYYVMDAKDGKIVSKGFDTEEEAKVEKFRIFEMTSNPLTQKKMALGGLFGDSRYNYGRSWTLDHRQHNKGQSYETPMKNRKRKY